MADFMEMLSSHQGRNYAEQIKIFNQKEKDDVYSEDFSRQVKGTDPLDYLIKKYEEGDTDDPIEKLLYLDMTTYLPEDLLVKMDIATMANSLEARVPFLDHQFIEEVTRVPSGLKLRRFTTKYILKRAFADILPDTILKRRKMGFGVPLSRWFRKELKEYTYEILLDDRAVNRGYFKRKGIERLLNDHISLRYDNSAKIWALLFLEVWFKIFMDREGDLASNGE
jgi:asparagine synthase (glutamine-hydrolysing)